MGKFRWQYSFVHVILILLLPLPPLDQPTLLDDLNLVYNLNQAALVECKTNPTGLGSVEVKD